MISGMAHLHGACMLGLVAMSALLSGACGSSPPKPVPPTPTGAAVKPRLIRDGERWAVTGLSADAADAIDQGRLVAVLRPTPGADPRRIAVFRTLGRPYGSTVDVALQCAIPGEQPEPGHAVKFLASNTLEDVGPCLARIVGQGLTDGGERYVRLDVGSEYLRPGDEYVILGTSVNAQGFVPLGLDTDYDGRCQIPADPTYLRPNTSHCMLVKAPRDRNELESGFAVFVPRQ